MWRIKLNTDDKINYTNILYLESISIKQIALAKS